ncbi:type III-B CRISPR module-associated protein Cmr5 [Stenoxybacter acetivorans]|uniref:type III-B CRISPR module-associated protein Cmr5 n=1 Tax=Stenoxybacter acetivorans TaxID=422441 RepID=UPI000568A3FB|nr:type III-B CRISPR module-associated protein Cmr5 [Stenoxybacter acetivorans]
MTSVTTRQQQWARIAFEQVSSYIEKKDADKKKYRSFARSFPSLVHSCGLAQAIAFAQAKEKEERTILLEHLNKIIYKDTPGKKLEDKYLSTDVLDYIHLSRQVLDVAGWLKRYAEALIEEEK